MNFFRQFVGSPGKTGAITSSSKQLTTLITSLAELSDRTCVVELGSGTGVFTEAILNEISPTAIFFCLEINKQFAQATRLKCPGVKVYQASAMTIQDKLLKHGVTHCDAIISGLPWASFNDEKQDELLTVIHDVLSDDGVFLTFAYLQGLALPAGKKFKKLLSTKFKSVEVSAPVWQNIPPAIVYKCTK